MTTPAFTALRHEIEKLHRDVPALAGFVAFGDDLAATDWTPFHVNAATLMTTDQGLFTTRFARLRDAFVAAGSDAQWRETYKDTDIGQDFMDRFACYCVVGPDAPWISRKMAGWVVYMPAGLYYPWHHHPAEEMYVVIAGEAVFMREGDAPETLRAGDTSFHASNRPHAMETRDHPVMAYVTWRNELETPPVLTERSIQQ